MDSLLRIKESDKKSCRRDLLADSIENLMHFVASATADLTRQSISKLLRFGQ
jgi:hypothetical protein